MVVSLSPGWIDDILDVGLLIVGLGLAVIFLGSIFRMGASLLAVLGSSLSLRQKVFVPLAWLPRDGAVVQAAITSMVVDTARQQGVDEAILHLAVKVRIIEVVHRRVVLAHPM